MARKVFISVLGAGFYGKCSYVSEGFKSSTTRFIQQATIERLGCKEWPEDSKAFILLTDKARTTNWEVADGKRIPYGKDMAEDYPGLRDTLDSMQLPFFYEGVPIPDGKDEKEMWKIFETTFHLLEENDEVYFDLTHSFRYLPMLLLVLGNYAKFLLHAKVKGISYGNYEARDTSNEAPLVDLLPLSSLQDWTFAIADYLENGYADRLAKLSQEELLPIIHDSRGEDKDAKSLNSLIKLLQQLTDERVTCRGLDVTASMTTEKVKARLESLSKVVIEPLAPVIIKVEEAVKGFSKDGGYRNMLAAARWCYDHHLYQQATTFLQEGVISFFGSRHGIDDNDRDARDLVNSAINVVGKPEEEWRTPNMDKLRKIVADPLIQNQNLVKMMLDLIDFRNNYNHCGMRKETLKTKTIIEKTKKFVKTIPEAIELPPVILKNRKHLFINLSNHPFGGWPEAQRKAATGYGEITDLPFPDISPEAGSDAIEAIAEEYAEKVREMSVGADATVHVMGEMNFTFALVSQLKALGIKCVASTTERCVEEKDGAKTSYFKFVKFREY